MPFSVRGRSAKLYRLVAYPITIIGGLDGRLGHRCRDRQATT